MRTCDQRLDQGRGHCLQPAYTLREKCWYHMMKPIRQKNNEERERMRRAEAAVPIGRGLK